jgi:hypothetical protein
MSNRSLLEFNHDCTGDLDASFVLALVRYLRSADRQTAQELERWGVHVVGMRHHSEKFVIDGRADGFPPHYLTPPTVQQGAKGGAERSECEANQKDHP